MTGGWRLDLARAILLPAAGLGIGFAFGLPGWGLAAGCAAALAWQLILLGRLARRLATRLPGRELSGLGGQIEGAFRRRLRRDRERRGELARLRREILESTRAMPDAAIVLDAEGAIQWANAAACRWFGLKLPADSGRPLVQLVRDPGLVERLTRPQEPGEVELASPVAPETDLLVHTAPYGTGRTLILARDITRLKRLERMRRDFVANVSHELRSPLTVVSGYLEMLEGDADAPSSWLAPLAEARRQVVRMVAIVNDLLALARLDSDANPPPRTAIDMPALLERVKDQAVTAGAGAREIRLDIQSPAQVLGAETEIESMVGNLVSNAVKYTRDDGHIVIVWRVAGRQGRLSVSDDGIGIPERDVPRLTERFYRVDKGRAGRTGGTGLGLAIVKHVAERHGARLYIESRLGHGSVFTLNFPASRTRLPQAKISAASV